MPKHEAGYYLVATVEFRTRKNRGNSCFVTFCVASRTRPGHIFLTDFSGIRFGVWCTTWLALAKEIYKGFVLKMGFIFSITLCNVKKNIASAVVE